jgi:hypothetical protein
LSRIATVGSWRRFQEFAKVGVSMKKPTNGGRSSPSVESSPLSHGLSRTLRLAERFSASIPVTVDALKRYTLTRDDERPLQFDGTVIAETESDSGPTIHRAAIYKTRGGKFISEFSSRPTFGALPTPSASEIASLKEDLVVRITDQAEWREGKTIEYANDIRNHDSAEALRRLAHELVLLPDSHPHWIELFFCYRHGKNGVESAEEEQDLIRNYGFNNDGSRASFFLRDLITLNRASGLDAQKMNGKAAVYEDLDSAITFFRPGRLTNELLKKLGRWDPEFIE